MFGQPNVHSLIVEFRSAAAAAAAAAAARARRAKVMHVSYSAGR